MHFHHVRGTKKFNINKGRVSTSIKELLAEIEKCDLVCPNCHALIHLEA